MSGTGTGIVTFSYADWSALFPVLAASVAAPAAQMYFNMATLYVDNTPSSQIVDSSVGGQRETILNLATAHCAALFASINGQPPQTLVGRISDASEGSVHVGTDMPDLPGSAAWWAQTPYGFAAWNAMAPYRMAHYRPAPRYCGPRGYAYAANLPSRW